MIDGFVEFVVEAGEASLFGRRGGDGPPLVLLHGFPETSAMWRGVAPLLADRFTVFCCDLRGYGGSSCPPSRGDHAPYAKRALAADVVALMTGFGFDRFAVAGHDRGGRVAYRMAMDYPERITALAVYDVVPVDIAWRHADDRFTLGFWPWSLLAQPFPLPEKLIGAAPEAVIDQALSSEWGTPATTFPAAVRAEYLSQLSEPRHLHAICEEYRAAAGVDRDHDRADARAGRRIECPTLVQWSRSGPLGSWYAESGGPLQVWREVASDVQGGPVGGGHFFPEEFPEETAHALADFLLRRSPTNAR